ncbi:MAG: glycosyltransferase family 2 protein [Saccharofermentanales bacterium]
MIYNIVLTTIGLMISFLLFYRFPSFSEKENVFPSFSEKGNVFPSFSEKGNVFQFLKKKTAICYPDKSLTDSSNKISIVIPARNEAANLPLLLQDLSMQIVKPYEIICVDDCSTDKTGDIASSFCVDLITISEKPDEWTGKAWACQQGANAATGDILLFLDADVRLSPDAIGLLLNAYIENHCVISVKPFHQTVKSYEQFSLFFNVVQIAANGTTAIFKTKNAGLYGPVIMISKDDYVKINGHDSAKNSIVDDLALGERLKQAGIGYKLFLGGKEISFHMYGSGFGSLLQGWAKNIASGAMKTPPLLFLMVFVWLTACIAVVVFLVQSLIEMNQIKIAVFFLLYLFWVFELYRVSRKIGSFHFKTIIQYPVYLAVFLCIFIYSLFKKIFHLDVVWKNRKIKLEK